MIRFFIRGKKNQEVRKIKTGSSSAIKRAYDRRQKDIDSLRQYDRGEKTIHAPNLRDIVRDVRTSS